MRYAILICAFALSMWADICSDLPALTPIPNGLSPTAPMGYIGWFVWGTTETEAGVRAQADAIVSLGLDKAGYQYVIIDEGWQGSRDGNGVLQPNATRFPSGIPALVDYIHAKGLKAGIYSSPGATTCAGAPGSQGHESQDASTWASWGIDFLFYDSCTAVANYTAAGCFDPATTPARMYQKMGAALQATGRPIVFNCAYYRTNDYDRAWAKDAGCNTAYVYDDVMGWWNSQIYVFTSIMTPNAAYAGPGYVNNGDHIGATLHLVPEEVRTIYAMASVVTSPLIVDLDFTTATTEMLGIVGNREVIHVNQDPLQVQGTRKYLSGTVSVWSKPLSNGDWAVVGLNTDTVSHDLTINWSTATSAQLATAYVKDLHSHMWLSKLAKSSSYTATAIPAHGSRVFRVSPSRPMFPLPGGLAK